MKIIIDDKIPYIHEAVHSIASEVMFVPGNEFTPQLVHDADVLIVRTRTHCNRALLEGSKVKFIATATIGFDHIDTAYCKAAGIKWMNCPGCNAKSVQQYIESALMLLKLVTDVDLATLTLGVVGVGNVGKKIVDLGTQLGMRVLQNDLPRAAAEGAQGFVSLDTIARECDIITFHTPLNRGGEFNTFHLADKHFFDSLKRRPLIINTSRGEVIQTQPLLDALNAGVISEAIIDVWENEPEINLELLEKVFLGTPHIAGYSADGKANATSMALNAVCTFYGINQHFAITPPAPVNPVIHADNYEEAVLMMYDPREDSNRLKEEPARFEWFRGHYPFRREKQAYEVILK